MFRGRLRFQAGKACGNNDHGRRNGGNEILSCRGAAAVMGGQQHIGRGEGMVLHQLALALDADVGGKKETAGTELQAEHQAPVIGRPGGTVIKKAGHTQAFKPQALVLLQYVSGLGEVQRCAFFLN